MANDKQRRVQLAWRKEQKKPSYKQPLRLSPTHIYQAVTKNQGQ